MEIRERCELVDVAYENDGKKAVLTFLDAPHSEVHTVNFNLQSYDATANKFVDDPSKAEKVQKWCDDYFAVPFASLKDAIGTVQNIYIYERFNSLFPVDIVEKFPMSMVGEFFQSEITEVIVDDTAVRIRFQLDGKTYESKMVFAKYVESLKQWFVDPHKKQEVYKKFEAKFHCPVEHADRLKGHPINVEVKAAFGSNTYADIKKFPEEKKGKK